MKVHRLKRVEEKSLPVYGVAVAGKITKPDAMRGPAYTCPELSYVPEGRPTHKELPSVINGKRVYADGRVEAV